MSITLLALQILILPALAAVLLRRRPSAPHAPRLVLLGDQLSRIDVRGQALDEHIRSAFSQMRSDIASEAQRTREASSSDFAALRTEVTRNISELSQLLQTGLSGFRTDNKT